MGKKVNIIIKILDVVDEILGYGFIVGAIVSVIFIFVFVKSIFKRFSKLRTPFYVFMTIATITDTLCTLIILIDDYWLWPVIGESKKKSDRKFYDNYINEPISVTIGTLVALDIHFDVILIFNRMTAFVFPVIHHEVSSSF